MSYSEFGGRAGKQQTRGFVLICYRAGVQQPIPIFFRLARLRYIEVLSNRC